MIIYLYVKTHNKTGLKYLGKTVSNDPVKYKGSGLYWRNHIAKHGYDVTTEILKECVNDDELKLWGQHYSELWDIVRSSNWANLKTECGQGGTGPNLGIHMRLPEHRERARNNNLSRSDEISIMMKTKNPMDIIENRNKISKKLKGVPKSEEHKKNMFNPMLDPDVSSNRRGSNNTCYNHKIYHFNHISSNTNVYMTQHDFIKEYSMNKGNISSMIHGNVTAVKGWIIIESSE